MFEALESGTLDQLTFFVFLQITLLALMFATEQLQLYLVVSFLYSKLLIFNIPIYRLFLSTVNQK